uniref:Uncharacterized protein n=1 Tax=Anopheles merus TaxID=30066 RepID=A0A182UTW1_ANOME
MGGNFIWLRLRSIASDSSSFSIFISMLRSLKFLFSVSLKNCSKFTPLWSVNGSHRLSRDMNEAMPPPRPPPPPSTLDEEPPLRFFSRAALLPPLPEAPLRFLPPLGGVVVGPVPATPPPLRIRPSVGLSHSSGGSTALVTSEASVSKWRLMTRLAAMPMRVRKVQKKVLRVV